jgi:hypothetical protein
MVLGDPRLFAVSIGFTAVIFGVASLPVARATWIAPDAHAGRALAWMVFLGLLIYAVFDLDLANAAYVAATGAWAASVVLLLVYVRTAR